MRDENFGKSNGYTVGGFIIYIFNIFNSRNFKIYW